MAITKSVVTEEGMSTAIPGSAPSGKQTLPKNGPGQGTEWKVADKVPHAFMGGFNSPTTPVKDAYGDMDGCAEPDPNQTNIVFNWNLHNL
jgi:hypothetical protein